MLIALAGLANLYVAKNIHKPEFERKYRKLQDFLVKFMIPQGVKEFLGMALIVGCFIYFTFFYE